MNEVIENILTRRSIRVYKPEQIGEEELSLILKAATYAPSGNNCQTWLFTAIQNKAVLEKLNTLVRGAYEKLVVDKNTYSSKVSGKKEAKNPRFSFYYNAPTLIIASNEKTYPNAFPDCAAAIQNMLLAAHSLGLGSCWINQLRWFGEEPELREELNNLGIPEDYMVCGAVAIGHAGREPKAAPRKENAIHFVR